MHGLGTIRAVHEMAVGSRLLARIKEVLVTAGEHVRADQVLVELDQADIQGRMNQSQAAVDAARARLAQASSDLGKIQQLLAQGAATTRELDDRQRAAWPITLDPIFSGLAWALIFGLFVSTAFALLLIPVIYWMIYGSNSVTARP